jgi:uncharacterized membrane protein
MTSESGVLLDRVLRPSPPLSPHSLIAVLALVALLNLAIILFFVGKGAWPVAPFMGADLALLAWAFRASSIAAGREERVTLTASRLRIVRKPPRGRGDELSFNPYWVRLQLDDPAEHGSQLTLWSHGKGLRIGAFLAPGERARFAKTLQSALSQARETIL